MYFQPDFTEETTFDGGVSVMKNANMGFITFRVSEWLLQRCLLVLALSAFSSHPSPPWHPFVFHSAKMCPLPSVRK